jgi:hypothetical protein
VQNTCRRFNLLVGVMSCIRLLEKLWLDIISEFYNSFVSGRLMCPHCLQEPAHD